jgi:hypothetical protein
MTMTRLFGALSLAAMLLCQAVPARASAIQLNDPSELSAGDTVVTFPNPLPGSSAFDVTAGAVTLGFSSPGLFNIFEQDGSFAPEFPLGAMLLANLFEDPLTITFSSGIREIGFLAQGFVPNQAQAFTVNLFQGPSTLTSFTVGPDDNAGLGLALFIGARATNGDLITRMTISNTGFAGQVDPAFVSAQDFDPSFVISPLTFGPNAAAETVPEPASLLLLGTGLLYGARRVRRRISS